MARRASRNPTFDLFSEAGDALRDNPALSWPAPDRFPLNIDRRRRVRESVVADLRSSANPLVISGFASLDELIDAASRFPSSGGTLRILLGHEPFASRRGEYRLSRETLPQEAQEYWLGRGISLLLSAKLVAFIDGLRTGRIEARHMSNGGRRLHAKIYCGDEAATLGSSNFTQSGLDSQIEANVRFARAREPKRYEELRGIAENYWVSGSDYRDLLLELLERLLKVVGWREALARSCAELLEGEWARAYLEHELPGASELWPSQRQGIAQALYILARQGSVLVADATGSGKTRMGSHLLRALSDQLLRSGRLRRHTALMVSPPAVSEAWRNEAQAAGASLDVYSHGTLSHERSVGHERLISSLRQSQVVCVDEGHNYLNIASQRSQHLLRNMADHVLVFTATPINRSVADLLRIADLLGADNLDESAVATFQRMLGKARLDRNLTESERDALRAEIKRFTVRRTKGMLNTLIEREPDAYLDARGKQCRFPKHRPRVYELGEPEEDRELARQIREIASDLQGVRHFQKPLELPEVLRNQGWTEAKYLESRLRSAKRLASYQVMAALRSSRAALIEHIEGTEQAKKHVRLAGYRRNQATGDMLAKLEEVAGKIPNNRMAIELPAWLSNEQAHREACSFERNLYAHILGCVARMSNHRERAKAHKLAELARAHDLVLAFDSRPITLNLIQQLLNEHASDTETLIATGEVNSGRSKLLKEFGPGSGARGIVGLCSDSVSEGVNLQQASCIVHLDMPSVVRIAEQRVGRVDRMDSPHPEIEAWWPEDADEFALSTDDRFIERYETVENLLGSNLPLPEEKQGESRALRAEELIKEYEADTKEEQWDGIDDAFEPVRALITGDRALVDHRTYESYLDISARVLARVSLVRAKSPWAFFCLAAGVGGAPRWVLLPSPKGDPILELSSVAQGLRDRLTEEAEDLPMNNRAEGVLREFIGQLGRTERRLLSRRKQRAIEEMERVLERFQQDASHAGEGYAVDQLHVLLRALHTSEPSRQPDWDEIATRWLDLIRPAWYERLKGKRKKPLLLKDNRRDLFRRRHQLVPQIIERFSQFPVQAPADERIQAGIIGVP